MSNSKNLKTVLNTSICLALAAIASQAAYADVTVKTKGGFELVSDDGEFSAKLGGRIHLDANYFIDEGDLDNAGTTAGTDKTNSTAFFRRTRLTLEGKAYGWKYKFENDFAGQGSTSGSGFREVWIGTNIMEHDVKFGQDKPFRGMEELTSSNSITMMERPMSSASGIYRQFQTGVFVSNAVEGGGYGVSVYNTRAASDNSSQGLGYNARGFITPINSNDNVLHIGLSGTVDKNPLRNTVTTTYTTSNDFSFRPRIVGRDGGLREYLVGSSTNNNVVEQTVIAAELAGAIGPFTAQAEYAKSKYDLATLTGTGAGGSAGSQDVNTYYLQTSYMLTGETKGYDTKKGVFRSPSVGETGAIELKARYDFAENTDTNAEATIMTVGMNYYFNPNVRAMLEYVDGEYTPMGTAAKKNASAVQARLQYSF